MRTLLAVTCLGVLSGCGWSETRYIDEFVQKDCEVRMECHDPAVLTFLGWETHDDCVADRGPEVTAMADDCTYNKKAARDCVKAMDEMACPEDGTELDYPEICDEVFLACEDTDGDDTGGEDTGDSGR